MDVPEAERNRFCLTDEDAIELAALRAQIEEHYQRPMDIEWAKDGLTGKYTSAGQTRDREIAANRRKARNASS